MLKNNVNEVNASEGNLSESRLLAEYRECFTNYIYRDQFVAHEFYLAVTIVGIVITIMNYLGQGIGRLGIALLVLIVFFALNILHIDLMRNSSSKKAAIERANEIENVLKQNENFSLSDVQLSHKVAARRQYLIERYCEKYATSYLMIIFIRTLIVVWTVYGLWKILSYVNTSEVLV